ncbi:MAG: hypothetical protein RMK19_08600 [Bacteroidia bacterium]|nr:hypothetical protein [Bacteroidia bacterium]MDW8016055.1 hypothetical protein [Bacteroidia bacterium]
MKWSIFKVVGSLCLAGGGWVVGDWYYMTLMRSQGVWILRGEGPLWDSAWVVRHIQDTKSTRPSQRIWTIAQTLQQQQLFAYLHFSYTGKGHGCLSARTRIPVARIVLPPRQSYVDAEGNRLPFIRPLDLPLIELPKWDSTAIRLILTFLEKKPLYKQLISYLSQDSDGIWQAHLEISSESFILGRTIHLKDALEQLDIYLRVIQPFIGGHSCRSVLLHIPNQIVCQ